jgi:hypothetical protein
MNELGFLVSEQTKRMYIDGHERIDVQTSNVNKNPFLLI